MKKIALIATILFVCVASCAVVPILVVTSLSSSSHAGAHCDVDGSGATTPGAGAGGEAADLTEEQAANASTIVSVATEVGAGEYGAIIAIATAWQESRLRNLDHGDRDSLGLFQQRPSQGWGTPTQVTNPDLAARAFFGRAQHTNNRGLLDVDGWRAMPVGQAAQAVQRSADPTGAWFGQHELLARQVVAGRQSAGESTTQVRVVQANIPMRTTNFAEAMAQVVQSQPDFVSLNEISGRRTEVLQPEGYEVFRDSPTNPRGQTHSTAVGWRTDTWSRVAGGRLLMVPDGPQQWDAGRSATWVTLTSSDFGEVSVVSVHHMINPAVHGPRRAQRQRLYEAGMRRLNQLVESLSTRGPVIVAGDFNSQYNANDPWGPRALLGEVGLRASFDFAGPTATHVGGGVIDYIFADPDVAVLERQWSRRIPSDHLLLGAVYSLTSTGAGGLAGAMCGPAMALDCALTPWPHIEEGLTPDALRVLRCVHQAFPEIQHYGGVADRPANPGSSHPTGRAVDVMIDNYRTPAGNELGTAVAEWVRGNAAGLGVRYIIWDERIWSTDRADEGWRPYRHPSGATDDNNAHRNHVHVDVWGNSAGAEIGDGSWVLPIRPPYRLSARFGQCGSMWANCHTGLDFATTQGTPIMAASAGTVTHTGWGGALGWLTQIDHGGGVSTWYAHQATMGVVRGMTVTAGQVIGTVGSTGNSSGPHLHLEVRVNGSPVDPARFLAQRGITP
ncbi:MAG: peptidoglycan DD-metalloendopeptidase family protein [Actinomycetota bacterium]|nr:peptidoglycan DD-metalloendopeptidase family protein [Actinomycetota bacterium]